MLNFSLLIINSFHRYGVFLSLLKVGLNYSKFKYFWETPLYLMKNNSKFFSLFTLILIFLILLLQQLFHLNLSEQFILFRFLLNLTQLVSFLYHNLFHLQNNFWKYNSMKLFSPSFNLD